MTSKTIKSGVFLIILFVGLCFSLMDINNAYAAAIPDGCPGSANPVTPGPATCSTIPAGCPGTTAVGPKIPSTTCPYESATSTSTNPQQREPLFVKNDCNKPRAELSRDNCNILKYLLDGINFLSAAVGIVVIMSIVLAGIQYTSSDGDPKKVAAAKSRIVNAVIAFFAFIFMYALLQYVVPGGVL